MPWYGVRFSRSKTDQERHDREQTQVTGTDTPMNPICSRGRLHRSLPEYSYEGISLTPPRSDERK